MRFGTDIRFKNITFTNFYRYYCLYGNNAVDNIEQTEIPVFENCHIFGHVIPTATSNYGIKRKGNC